MIQTSVQGQDGTRYLITPFSGPFWYQDYIYEYDYQAKELMSEPETQLPFERELLSCELKGVARRSETRSLSSESHSLNGLPGELWIILYCECKELLTDEEREFCKRLVSLLQIEFR